MLCPCRGYPHPLAPCSQCFHTGFTGISSTSTVVHSPVVVGWYGRRSWLGHLCCVMPWVCNDHAVPPRVSTSVLFYTVTQAFGASQVLLSACKTTCRSEKTSKEMGCASARPLPAAAVPDSRAQLIRLGTLKGCDTL